MKKLLTIAATFALAVAGITTIGSPESASAVSPTSNLYGLNVANQGSGSGANNFLEHNGKTYFIASTLSKATSIWSVDGDITKDPELVYDPFDGPTSGRIERMFAYDKFLFFFVRNTQAGGPAKAIVVDLNTKVAKELKSATGESLISDTGWFSETNGTVYGFQGNWSSATIVKFNPTEVTLEPLTTTPVAVQDTPPGDSFLTGSPYNQTPGMIALGNFLYVFTTSSSYNRDDARVYRYDLTTDTWSSELQIDGQVLQHIRVNGKVTYAGETGFLIYRATIINTQAWAQWISGFETYFVKSNGDLQRLGTWVSGGNAPAAFNFNGDLFAVEEWGSKVYKYDSVTGEQILMRDIWFPGSTGMSIRAIKDVGNNLVFSANTDPQNQTSGFLLYSWDGTNAASRFTDVNPALGQRDYDVSHTNSNTGYNYEIGAVGNYTIKVLNRDSAIGPEPYYIAPNGTVTLMKDMNKASDGSSPDTDCFISTTSGDWMTGNIPLQNESGYGKDVIVSMKPEGSFLQYSVIDPGNLRNPCGFAYVGADVFFQADDIVTGELGMYKMTPDGTITNVANINSADDGAQVVVHGTDYYWLGDDYYDYNLWKFDTVTNTLTQLTGLDEQIIRSDDTYEMELVGSKLYLLGEQSGMNEDDIFVADLTAADFNLVNLTTELSTEYSQWWNAENLTEYMGRLIFSTETANRDEPEMYEVNYTTGAITKLFDIDAVEGAQGWVYNVFAVGSKLFMQYETNDGNYQLRKWTTGPAAVSMPLPADFNLNCVAPIGADLVIQRQNGESFFYGNGLNPKPIDYNFSGDDSAFCDAKSTEHGSYLSLPEYPYDSNGVGFSSEPGYIGPLTPIAVSRLGEPVNEGPSVPKSSETPSETTPVAPGTPGTPVAVASPGKVTLNWTAPTTGGAVSTYVVQSTPEGALCEIVGTEAECIGLEPGVSYTFSIVATNAGGLATSSVSNSVTAIAGGGAPGIPGNVVVTPKDGGATISWTAPATGGIVDSYVVQSTPPGATCVVTGTTADCTGLTNGDLYSFTVIAVNDVDITLTLPTEAVTIGDPATMVPSTPKAPVLKPGNARITATVTPPTAAGVATSYRVYLYGDNNYECVILAPEVSCVFENLNPDYQYNAYYVAINENGESNGSNYSDYVYPLVPAVPGVPGAPTLTAGSSKVTVKVTPPSSGGEVLSYNVTLNPGGAVCTITVPDTECDITGLDPSVAYSATVVAVNELGESEPSEASAEVTPLANTPETPAAPTLTTTPGKLTVTVTPASSGPAATSYRVTLTPGGATCTITAPDTSCDFTDLDPTVAYSATVVAINADGESEPSVSSAEVTPMDGKPSAPTISKVVAGDQKVTVTVTPAATGAAATTVTVTANPGGFTCEITLPAKSCVIEGLDNGVAYTFTATASNEDGTSASSSESASVTPAKWIVQSLGTSKFSATSSSAIKMAWDKASGKLIVRTTGVYTGYIEAKLTFTKDGTTYTCTTQFGVVKPMPMKTKAQKLIAMKMKTFTGKQFCSDLSKLDPKSTSPKGGLSKANFKKIKPVKKSSSEVNSEKAAAAALKNFTGTIAVEVTRYRAWPTTMANVGNHSGKGGEISTLVRRTSVTLG